MYILMGCRKRLMHVKFVRQESNYAGEQHPSPVRLDERKPPFKDVELGAGRQEAAAGDIEGAA